MQKNLILVANPIRMDFQDFKEIALGVRRENRSINVFVVTTDHQSSVIPEKYWAHPTLTVSFGHPGKFKAARGIMLHNQPIHKFQQYVQFRLADIDTPRTGMFDRAHIYEPADWGEFCIIKPADLGKMSKGGSVQWLRTKRLRSFDPGRYPENHVLRNSGLLVQSFIDTGRCPLNWRVLTLFGEPLYCFKSACPAERPPLDAPDSLIEAAVIEPKHPQVKKDFAYEEIRAFEIDEEVIAFARQIYRAFPRIPLQGCDILREAGTGRLYVLEVNPGGNTWHFSSPYFARQRALLGGKEVFTRQLDAFARASCVLAEKTDRLAA